MLDDFFIQLSTEPDSISFAQTMAVIDKHYDFTAVAFENGEVTNAADQSNGSCKIFAFGLLHQLSEPQTLQLFGEHYRQVMATPSGTDHQNIRNFLITGWNGIRFSGNALQLKSTAV
ncbi:HopJ type III effector protein [Rheinheimera sp. UJ63]|uniref:HopJ type III effector protein n=1 Tax=Rheinheimera sp. UJ63 TaxID=2910157 RepID=UPI001F189C87|nr:HopJ type III effector protein [Rheinheimera sp. UJ63]MCF4010330.1 HopJ type III effector protein [Rheinheimera sp. UJ63]